MFAVRIVFNATQLVLHEFVFLFQIQCLFVQLEDLVRQLANVLLVADDLLAQLMVLGAHFEHGLFVAFVLFEQFGFVFGLDFTGFFVVEGFLCGNLERRWIEDIYSRLSLSEIIVTRDPRTQPHSENIDRVRPQSSGVLS